MKLGPDIVQSINESYIELGGCWLWADDLIYDPEYLEVLSQPVSLDCITLDYLRFKVPMTNITIRFGSHPTSPLIYNAVSYMVDETPDDLSKMFLSLGGGTLTGSLSGTSISISGNISANSFVKNGGTSGQFLKADGSVDSNSYALTSSFGAYLPISGGQLTGNLSGLNISANGSVILPYNPNTLAKNTLMIGTSANFGASNFEIGVGLPSGAVHWPFGIMKNGVALVTIDTSGNLISTSFKRTGGSSSQFLKADGSVDTNSYALNSSLGNYLPTSGGTVNGNVNVSGNLSAINIYGNISGTTSFSQSATSSLSAFQADKLKTARTFAVSGDVSAASQTFDGTANVTFVTVLSAIGTSGVYTKVQTDSKGRVISGSNLTSGDIPVLNYLPLSGGLVSGTISASSFVVSGGSSNQFLKADGSLDMNSFGNYLPLSGGRLTGNLSGLNISANGSVILPYNPNTLVKNTLMIGSSADFGLSNFEIGIGLPSGAVHWPFGIMKNGVALVSIDTSGNMITNSFKKTGGTSTQFLKADGSVDTNSYALNSSLGNYLPTSGGTLTGSLKCVASISAAGDIIATNHVVVNPDTTINKMSSFVDHDNFDGYSLELVTDSNNYVYASVYNGGYLQHRNLLCDDRGNATVQNILLANGLNANFSQITSAYADKIIKNGGTSAQFLKADGSVDMKAYFPVSGLYVPGTNVVYGLSGTVVGGQNAMDIQLRNSNIGVDNGLIMATVYEDDGVTIRDRAILVDDQGNASFGKSVQASVLQATGNVYGAQFKKSGGTSAQFLKADGSVDTRNFANYLPLSAGSYNWLTDALFTPGVVTKGAISQLPLVGGNFGDHYWIQDVYGAYNGPSTTWRLQRANGGGGISPADIEIGWDGGVRIGTKITSPIVSAVSGVYMSHLPTGPAASYGSRSQGARIVLDPTFAVGSSTDVAIGLDQTSIWYQTKVPTDYQAWYLGPYKIMEIFNTSGLIVSNEIHTTQQFYVNNTKVVDTRDTGWSSITGTAQKGGLDADAAFWTDVGGKDISQLPKTIKAMYDALVHHGLIGA